MGRAASLAVVVALTACAAPRPHTLLGERVPVACEGDRTELEQCASWVIDRVLAMLEPTRFRDDAISAYVTSVGERLVRAHGDRRAWRFLISDSKDVEAYAGLSTMVFVNRGTLALLRDEAELAAVLAHEIAHVLGGHLHDNYQRFLASDVGHSADAEAAARRFARDDEIQADEVAVLLLAKAGYDPRAVERMLRALATTSPEDGNTDDAQHPRWVERVARAQAIAAAHPGGETGEARYRARMAALVVGEDPRVASLVGGAAVFVRSGVAIDVPPGATATDEGDGITLALDAETRVALHPLDPLVARNGVAAVAGQTREALALVEGTDLSLLVAVVGPDANAVAGRIRASARAPTRAELAAIVPVRVDLDAPRALWSP